MSMFEKKNLERILKEAAGYPLAAIAALLVGAGLLTGLYLFMAGRKDDAAIKSVIVDAQRYAQAYRNFSAQYQYPPGDLPAAEELINVCGGMNAEGRFCRNGDGNRVVGVPVPDISSSVMQAGMTVMPEVETSMFWKHLAIAGIIQDVDINADPAAKSADGIQPFSALGPFDVFFMTATNRIPQAGHWLRLLSDARAVPYGAGKKGPLTVREAQRIDRIVDDGVPYSGLFIASMTEAEGGQAKGCAGAFYDTDVAGRRCVGHFRLD